MSIIGFFIEVLFVTNFWVLLYNNILRWLDIRFPTKVPLEFIRSGAVPEPFEITLYLFLSLAAVVILYLVHSRFPIAVNPRSSFLKIIILVLLSILFLKNIGNYPMARDHYPYSLRNQLTYSLYFLFYVGINTLLLLEFTFLFNLSKRSKKIFIFLLIGLLIFVIAIFTFEPHFPMVGHDYSYFLGPIWEVAHGKTIYTQIPSQYGFLSILIFTFLYKIGLLSYFSLPILVWLFYIAQYFICFYLIYKLSKSFFLALLGLFSIMTINYFSLYHLPASIPQIGPMRWLPFLIGLLLLYKIKKIDSPKLIVTIAFLSFWIIDSGIALISSYLLTLILLKITNLINWKKGLLSVLILFTSMFFIFLTINFIHLILGYQAINLFALLSKLKDYGKAGFGMLPIDTYVYFWIVIMIYFASIIYFFRTSHKNKKPIMADGGSGRDPTARKVTKVANNDYQSGPNKYLSIDQAPISHHNEHWGEGGFRQNLNNHTSLLLFSANISLFASIYYVGRSHQHNLFTIALFPLLTAFFLLANFFNSLQLKAKILVGTVLLLTFIAYPAFQRQEVITEMIQAKVNRLLTGNVFSPELPHILQDRYPTEPKLIKKHLPEKKIVILSADDTYLFYLTDKENLMMDNSQITILTQKDMDFSLKDVYKSCPKKIVTDCQLMGKCERSNPVVIGFFSIQPLLLNKIEQKCNLDYRPVECTDQLCISEANKN